MISRTRDRSANGLFVKALLTLRAMHRLLVIYPRPTDPDHLRSYYEDTHLPLAAKFPGLRGYRYSFDVAAAGASHRISACSRPTSTMRPR